MVCTFTHFSIVAEDIDESRKFYEELFGMEPIPHPEFQAETEFLRCGSRQLHLFVVDDEVVEPMTHAHFAVHVDNFEEVYRKAKARELFSAAGRETAEPRVFELPDGTAQMYLRDPAGNLVEVNYPNVDDLDPELVTVVKREESSGEEDTAITGSAVVGGSKTGIYTDEVLDEIREIR